MRTTCAPIVLGVCGWALAPRTAHPRVGSALGSFTWGQCSAVSGCAAHYHTLEQPQSLSTRRTRVPRGRGSTARPITPTHGPEDSTSRNAVPARAIPAPLHAPHSVSWPYTDNPNPRHDGHEREVQAGWGRCGRTVRGDCPRSRGRHMGVIFHLLLRPWIRPPLKRYQQHASALSWPRLVVPSCRPSTRGRRSGPVPARDRLHGRHMCVVPVARRPSRLVTLPWAAAHPQALVQLVQLMCAV